MKFAKIEESEEYGQILITKSTAENPDYEGPCPIVQFEVSLDGARFGSQVAWEPSEEGWDNRGKYFDSVDLEIAESFVKDVIQTIMEKAEND